MKTITITQSIQHRTLLLCVTVLLPTMLVSGCSTAGFSQSLSSFGQWVQASTGNAQAPETSHYATQAPHGKVVSAAGQTFTAMGKLVELDRANGLVRGEKASVPITIKIVSKVGGAAIAITTDQPLLAKEFVARLQVLLDSEVKEGVFVEQGI